jgi:hypothetical protein
MVHGVEMSTVPRAVGFLIRYLLSALTVHEAVLDTSATRAPRLRAPPRTEELRLHAVRTIPLNGTHFSVNRLSLNWKFHYCFSVF